MYKQLCLTRHPGEPRGFRDLKHILRHRPQHRNRTCRYPSHIAQTQTLKTTTQKTKCGYEFKLSFPNKRAFSSHKTTKAQPLSSPKPPHKSSYNNHYLHCKLHFHTNPNKCSSQRRWWVGYSTPGDQIRHSCRKPPPLILPPLRD